MKVRHSSTCLEPYHSGTRELAGVGRGEEIARKREETGITEVHWPASLQELLSSVFSEKPYLKKTWRLMKIPTCCTNTHNPTNTEKSIFLGSGIVPQACNPTTWEVETGELLRVLGPPGLHNKFQAGQSYIARSCLNQTKTIFYFITHSKQK